MKKKKNNVVSEEIISEEDIFDEETIDSPIKKDKSKIILTIAIVVVLLIIVGVLAFFVYKKYSVQPLNDTTTSSVVEEPVTPFVSVSTTPSPTVVASPEPTIEPTVEPTLEIEEVHGKKEDSLSLEELESSSLNLEEFSENSEENLKYKDIAVYYVNGLKTFHEKDCPVIKDKDKIKTTGYSALNNGFEACEECKPLSNPNLKELSEDELDLLDEIKVYKTASNTKYHTKNCSILKDTGIEISLKEAIENNLEACSLCNPKTLETYKTTEITKTPSSTPTPTKKPTVIGANSNSSGNNTSKITPTATVNKVTPTNIPVSSLSITGGTVKVGEYLQLYISFAPVNAVSTLTYSTSNSNIATINSNGIVTGVSTGTVTISLTASNGVSASSIVNVTANSNITTTPTNTPTTPTNAPYTDSNLDVNNLGLTGISKFICPSNINLIDMEAMSDWQAFIYKINANGGEIITTGTSITLNAGGVTRLQLVKYNDNEWSLRIYDSLLTYINKCTLKAICTKISSMPDTIYTNIYKDYEENEFIGERYRSIGDSSIKAEVAGDSVTYYIKDVNYEY